MQLHADRSGDGPPLVLVHGITESSAMWAPLVADLATTHDVIAVDLRGHGRSPKGDGYDPMTLATDVHDTITALGVEAPTLIGHSLGGVVVSAYAAAYPTCGVVNIDQPLRLDGFKDALGQLEPMLRGDTETFQNALAMMFGSMMGPLPAHEVERMLALRRSDQEVVLAIWGPVFDTTEAELEAMFEEMLGAIKVPYLALHGGEVGDDYAAWLTRLVPKATVEVWPEHGHYPHLVDPQRFLARFRAWAA